MGESETHRDLAYDDPVFGGVNQLNRHLASLDDRGLVLSLAAFAEDALGSLLKAFMLPSDATASLLEGFNAPLGTLSARIKACYSLGLITKDQFSDLECLRKVRNDFAHAWRPLDFTQARIAGHVATMSYGSTSRRFPETPAEKIRESSIALLTELRMTTHAIESNGWQATSRGSRAILGFSGEFEAQLDEARTEFADFKSVLTTALGERRRFTVVTLRQFAARLETLELNCPDERRQEVEDLQAEVQSAIADLSTV